VHVTASLSPSITFLLSCRLTEALSDDPLLGRLVKQQNERVHDAAKQGLDHPLLQ
jgi:hypothetical protein